MNRDSLATAAIAACVAALSTLAWTTLFTPGTVNAAPDPAPQAPPRTMRVALVNLEEVSRNTPLFRRLRSEWDDAQADIKSYNNKLQREYDARLRRIEAGGGPFADEDDVLTERVELQAIKETQKAAKEEGEKYLDALLSDFQKQVLQEVMVNLKRYIRQNGYDIALQDYSVETGEVDFFSAGEYAQSLMSKPVLDAPGALDGSNVFVTDITQEMVTAMQKGGVPEDPDDG